MRQDRKNKIRNKENRNDRSVINEAGDKKRQGPNLHEYEQLSEKAVDLIFNNKINAKNAFDVNVDYLDKLPHLLKKNEETSWQKASASLDASAKIYGYRVDSVHSETFKFLGGLSRAEKDEKNEEGGELNEEERKKKNRENRHDGYSTLESNPKKLDLVKYDLEFEVDPLFKSMTAKFGDSGARGLLLKTLPLDKNMEVFLESNEDNALKSNLSPVEKSEKLDRSTNINSDVLSVIDTTLSLFTIQDLKSLQICPDLSYFKKERELETSLEKTFYANLMSEFDDTILRENLLNDKSQISSDSLNNSFNFNDNDNDQNENFSSVSQRSSYESNLSAKFDDMNMNINNFGNELKHIGASYMEGFSYLKSDEIKEYIHQFGDGNKQVFKNMPQYKNFTKSFGQLEKFNLFNNPISKLEGGKKEKRVKKEEVFFNFSVDEEVKKSEIFEKESKAKKNVNTREVIRKNNKKKVKQYFHYDRSVLFNLFSIQDRLISENNDLNRENEEHQIQNFNDDNFSNPGEGNIDEEGKSNFEPTFVKIDSEYEKKFGRLYKTFDVRMIKSKIWDSISLSTNKNNLPNSTSDTGIEFKKIIESVYGNLTKEVVSNISTPTCFVCLLHLSNEKKEVDQNNFIIKTESGQKL